MGCLMTAKNFVLMERDFEILKALNEYRYLSTSQVYRLLFSDNTTIQSTRRRLRYLFGSKYIGKIAPYVQVGQSGGEMAYHINRNGIKVLGELGIASKSPSKINKVKHLFLQHALDLSDFRVHLTKALISFPEVHLEQFIPDFERKAQYSAQDGMRRYSTYREVLHTTLRRPYVVYPDAVIILRSGSSKRLYFLEIDRGTEGLEQIRTKLVGYNLFFKKRLFQEYGEFTHFHILFQTNSKKRMNNIHHAILDQEGSQMVRVTHREKVTDTSILTSNIWLNHENKYKSILTIK